MTKETKAILGAFIFILVSIGIYWVLKWIKIEEGITYPFILLSPILVYLIFAEKIASFKAGGVEATFKEIANEKVKTDSSLIDELPKDNKLEVIEKGSVNSLRGKLEELKDKSERGKKIVTLELGKGENYYDVWAVKQYIKALSAFRNFRFVVIVNNNKEVIAFISKDKMSKILENNNLGNEFIKVINKGKSESLNIFPGLITVKITEDTKNIEALKKMEENSVDELIVCDSEGKLKGVIEREDILSKLMIALAE